MTIGEEMTVYVVDDDAAVLDGLAHLVRSIGLKTQSYEDPSVFLSEINMDACGCLILDIRMPVINGFMVFDRLRAMGCELPVIMMTGYADVSQCRRAFQQGAVDFLIKPIDENGLLERVQKATRMDQEQRMKRRLAETIRCKLEKLTHREKTVFDMISDGMPNKVIADRLHLSLRTVEAHRASVFEKVEAASVADLVKLKLLGTPWLQ